MRILEVFEMFLVKICFLLIVFLNYILILEIVFTESLIGVIEFFYEREIVLVIDRVEELVFLVFIVEDLI